MKIKATLQAWALCLLFIMSCGSPLPQIQLRTEDFTEGPSEEGEPSEPEPSTSHSEDSQSGDSSSGSFDSFLPPSLPEITKEPQVYLNLTEITRIDEIFLDIPVIEFSLVHADFVRIMRCSADYPYPLPPELRYEFDANAQMQTSMDRQIADELLKEQLGWSWDQAILSRRCKIISQRSLFGIFEDISAEPGEFYYVLNPCILDPKDTDSDKAGLCSFRIQISPKLSINRMEDNTLATLRQNYAASRSHAESTLSRLRTVAAKIERLQKNCEKEIANHANKANFWTTVGQLANIGLNSAIGSATGGLGGALLAAPISSLVSSVFGKLASPPRLNAQCLEVQKLVEEGQTLATQYELALSDLRLKVAELEMSQVEP